ncbi:lipoxygenase family protein [Serratia plymuthica]|uniref:lipoxygenase family protein n=1 Tax=Serratia plymuthica TaxID=82996 RepID=UPI003DA42A1B
MIYNWTENLSPMIGVPMLDIPAGQDLPQELHPRQSYNDKLIELGQLVSSNHQQYYISQLSNPTEIQLATISRLVKLEQHKFKALFNNESPECRRKIDVDISELEIAINEWSRGGDTNGDLAAYNEQYKTISIPASATHMHEDDYFAYWRLAGNNPTSLRGTTTLPDNFPLTEEQYQLVMGSDDSLSLALKEKRIYMLDYSNINDATAEQGYSKPVSDTDNKPVIGYSYAAMAAFAVSKKDRRLKSVAIQCGQNSEDNNPMFLALNDPEHYWGWERAKMVIQAADKTEHQLANHLGLTHLLCEAFAIATIRKLKSGHPVYDLLISHFEGTNRINHNATLALLGPGQFVDTLMAAALADLAKTSIDIRLNYNFYDHFLPTELKLRGVDDVNALPEYPYRDDGLLIWNAILEFVNSYLSHFYVTSAVIKEDQDLNNWMDDLLENGKIKGFKKITTRDELAQILTMIIFTSSAQHAAVNFTQPSWMMYAPCMVGTLNYHKPTAIKNATREEWLKMLPVLTRAMKKIDIYTVLGNLYNGYLGEYVSHDGNAIFDAVSAPAVYKIIQDFRKNLQNIESTIQRNNTVRQIPYETLLPSKIPASINI